MNNVGHRYGPPPAVYRGSAVLYGKSLLNKDAFSKTSEKSFFCQFQLLKLTCHSYDFDQIIFECPPVYFTLFFRKFYIFQ